MCICLWDDDFVSFGYTHRRGFAGYTVIEMTVLFLIFWGTFIVFSIIVLPIYFLANKGFPFLHILNNTCFFFKGSHLKSVRRYLTVVLLCTSLIISDVEHYFMYLLVISLSSLEKCVFSSSAWLLTRLVCLLFAIELYDLFSGSDGKASAYNAGNPGLIPGSGRSDGEGNGSPLQYSCLENPMDRGAW